MLSDIIIYNKDKILDYKLEIIKGEIFITVDTKKIDTVNVFIDTNVYDHIKFIKVKTKKILDDEFVVSLTDSVFSFKLRCNYKFLVKSIYKFINRNSDRDTLVSNLNLFLESKVGKKYNDDLIKLIRSIDIDNKVKGKVLDIDNDRVDFILFSNELYNKLAGKMKFKDLLFLIVSIDNAFRPPKINNIVFNCLVTNAVLSKRNKSYLLNLANTYRFAGFDYSRIDEFFIKEGNVEFFIKYLNIDYGDKLELIDKVIEFGSKEFIDELLKNKEFKSNKYCYQRLKEVNE